MSICSYCHLRIKHNGFNVGEWWNNESDMVKVCSTECKDKLWKMVQDGTWMDHKPEAMFPEYHNKKKIPKGPVAFTDTQFETTD